jgi:hypothetical protein
MATSVMPLALLRERWVPMSAILIAPLDHDAHGFFQAASAQPRLTVGACDFKDLDVQVMKLQDGCTDASSPACWLSGKNASTAGRSRAAVTRTHLSRVECGRWMLMILTTRDWMQRRQVQDVKHVDPALVAYFRAVRFCAIERTPFWYDR